MGERPSISASTTDYDFIKFKGCVQAGVHAYVCGCIHRYVQYTVAQCKSVCLCMCV